MIYCRGFSCCCCSCLLLSPRAITVVMSITQLVSIVCSTASEHHSHIWFLRWHHFLKLRTESWIPKVIIDSGSGEEGALLLTSFRLYFSLCAMLNMYIYINALPIHWHSDHWHASLFRLCFKFCEHLSF